jgi:glycosyltransferase involved in cell wall biosynthesis
MKPFWGKFIYIEPMKIVDNSYVFTDINKQNVCCVVPARNESGHLIDVINNVLSVSEITEIIIVEGGSADNTWVVAQGLARKYPDLIKIHKQTGKGKFNAVMEGALASSSDLILIWDADGTVPLEDSKKVITRSLGSRQPAMGDRLRGKIEPGAMQSANWIANWGFAILWAPILRDRPRDMLCGTKIFPREIFVEMPGWLIEADPYGDFALVGHARMQGMKIESCVVNYGARTYGQTNIHRWSGGVQLLKATVKIYWTLTKISVSRKGNKS